MVLVLLFAMGLALPILHLYLLPVSLIGRIFLQRRGLHRNGRTWRSPLAEAVAYLL